MSRSWPRPAITGQGNLRDNVEVFSAVYQGKHTEVQELIDFEELALCVKFFKRKVSRNPDDREFGDKQSVYVLVDSNEVKVRALAYLLFDLHLFEIKFLVELYPKI